MLGPGRWLMLAGAVLVLAGALVRRWAARHNLEAAAADADALQVYRRGTPAAIEAEVEGTEPARAGAAAGATVRATTAHGLARVGHTAAVVLVLIGLALVGGGFLWR